MRDALPGTGNRGQPNYTTCGGWALSENPTYCAFWSVFGAACLSLQPMASSVGFGTTARVAPGKNLPDSGVTSEPVGCYATPAQLGGSSGFAAPLAPLPVTRSPTAHASAHYLANSRGVQRTACPTFQRVGDLGNTPLRRLLLS